MILETLKQYVLFVCTICTYFNMYTTDDEQNHLAKYIKEFKVRPQSDSKSKTTRVRPQSDSKFKKKAKEDVLNSAMALLKGREMVFKAFESRIFSRLKQSEQSEK